MQELIFTRLAHQRAVQAVDATLTCRPVSRPQSAAAITALCQTVMSIPEWLVMESRIGPRQEPFSTWWTTTAHDFAMTAVLTLPNDTDQSASPSPAETEHQLSAGGSVPGLARHWRIIQGVHAGRDVLDVLRDHLWWLRENVIPTAEALLG